MISIILLEHENSSLNNLKFSLKKLKHINLCGIYTDIVEFWQAFKEQSPDAVLLSAELSELNHIEIALNIRKLNKETEVIFVSTQFGYEFKHFELNSLDSILQHIDNLSRRNSSSINFQKSTSSEIQSLEHPSYFIHCFKKFSFIKKDSPELSMKWRTKKVKELFAYLICNYEHSISKDELMSILYEGESKKKAQNNLYVTMSYLRKQLSEFGIGRNKLLIKDNYTLELADGICDFVDFDRFFKKNLVVDDNNILETEKIINLYNGMFLDEEDYPWAYEMREYLDQKYEDTLLSIGNYYIEHLNIKNAEKAFLKILSTNPISYNANTQLLDLYINHKKTGLFAQHFIEYSKLLASEFGETPEKRYLQKFHILVQENKL